MFILCSSKALAPDGSLVDDFVFREGFVDTPSPAGSSGVRVSGGLQGAADARVKPRVLHVLNAPSPAATSSLAIANYILDRAQNAFQLSPPTP